MLDREKVNKAMKICMDEIDRECTQCPYRHRVSCLNSMLADAITMMKQEAVVRCKDCKHRPK